MEREIKAAVKELLEKSSKKDIANNEVKILQAVIEKTLEINAVKLEEVELTRERYNFYFPEGKIESPIETIKMGAHQFEKLQRSDRNTLLKAVHETLINPSLIIEKETFDQKSEEFKPLHIYGKSFYREETNHKRLIESVVVFKETKNIIISAHNKSLHDFSKQIKTADQLIYVDEYVGRMAAHLLKEVGSPVRLQGIKTRAINLNYNQKEILSSNYYGKEAGLLL